MRQPVTLLYELSRSARPDAIAAVDPDQKTPPYAQIVEQVQDAGWIVSDGRRGTRVTELVPTHDKRVRGKALRDAVGKFVTSLTYRGYSKDEIADELRRAIRTS